MASEVAAKWVIALVIYFFVMTFVVSLISNVTPVDVTEQSTTDYTGCGSPRLFYESYSLDPITLEDYYGDGAVNGVLIDIAEGMFDCDISYGVLSNESCSSLNGCTWESADSWWNPFDDETPTCTGSLDYPSVTNDTQVSQGWRIIIDDYENLDGETTNFVCTHPEVIYNETLCSVFSCTWGEFGGINSISVDNVDPNLSMIGTMWHTIKDMFVFRFDFGFEDTSGNAILTFLVFVLPLLALILAIIVLVRG